MNTNKYYQLGVRYLHELCVDILDRSVGSEGNRKATRFFEETVSSLGWKTQIQEFDAVDWEDGKAILQTAGHYFEVFVSPYSLGCEVEAQLISVSSIKELESINVQGSIVLLHGEIAKEQLMPKNFVFYNPEEHQKINSLLENGSPSAIICATGRNASLAGGVYPFPLIEDGDFDIPSVYMTDIEGGKLLPFVGSVVSLKSVSKRIPGNSCNIIASRGENIDGRVVITAHIDAKKGSPGAIDNATGVVILLLLAGLMADYDGNKQIELIALNGEDYYAAPGQLRYIQSNQDRFHEIILNINMDGAGYVGSRSAFSFYGLPEELEQKVNTVIDKFKYLTRGDQWVQGDHSIFTQNGCPAMAVSSEWLIENIDSQEITHTPKDNVDIVDCYKLVEIAQALNQILRKR